MGLYFTIDSARSLKPQKELSENQDLLDNDNDLNHQFGQPSDIPIPQPPFGQDQNQDKSEEKY